MGDVDDCYVVFVQLFDLFEEYVYFVCGKYCCGFVEDQ